MRTPERVDQTIVDLRADPPIGDASEMLNASERSFSNLVSTSHLWGTRRIPWAVHETRRESEIHR